jgi:hypothetical protein
MKKKVEGVLKALKYNNPGIFKDTELIYGRDGFGCCSP